MSCVWALPGGCTQNPSYTPSTLTWDLLDGIKPVIRQKPIDEDLSEEGVITFDGDALGFLAMRLSCVV